ncbi:Pre-mRNA-splicing factor, putative (Spliceosome maturation protein, putative) [Candida maltosa Xu316]|uniref:Pre-mRNA-splicing factor, putative (Spliceosome maturation protein, putative) n=1 Tax=Candida maltosa (strain Xu316) TaxID=1245528 RepID=M3K5J0_CANMX|nr:Pre-mRNA-splicing factor, putative (Spliceosome maturation protein, putative) [Candida maltosa Xu316]
MSGIKLNLKKTKKDSKLKKPLEKEDEPEKKVISSYSKTEQLKTLPNRPTLKIANPNAKIINYGLTTFEQKEGNKHSVIGQVVIPDSDGEEEDETRIAPEEFGAAFLRGLGWKDEEESARASQQQRVTLGIGAKPVDSEILQDFNKEDIGIPLIKRRKTERNDMRGEKKNSK